MSNITKEDISIFTIASVSILSFNSFIVEEACKCAAMQLMCKYKVPFDDLVEFNQEEEEAKDITIYKEEYQDEFNKLYDMEYSRIYNELKSIILVNKLTSN